MGVSKRAMPVRAAMFAMVAGVWLAGQFGSSHAHASELSASSAAADANTSEGNAAATPDLSANAVKLRVGDTLKVAFYEKFDVPEEKWSGAVRNPGLSFHQFAELCGEYVVQEDGTLSFPILGRIPAAGRDRSDVLSDLSRSFEGIVGRPGFVNVIAIEHQPIFVAGTVKNPGAFKFWQGMTVLHAVALAGGPKVATVETWQRVESGREIERLQRALTRVKRLLVRTDLLRSEAGGPQLPPVAMSSLVGRDAAGLVSDERAARVLTSQTQAAAETALRTAVDDAHRNLQARTDRLQPLDNLIAARLDRSKTIAQLAERDSVSRPVMVQTESELADAQDRKRQAVIEVAQARNEVAKAEHALADHDGADAIELARTTQATERDAQEAVSDAEGALTMFATLTPRETRAETAPETYQVVRKTGTGSTVLTLPGTAPLEPGDLVQAGPAGEAARP